MNKTIIDVLDNIFNGRDYIMSELSDKEIEDLSLQLTDYSINFKAPPRVTGSSRLYLGGVVWNNLETKENIGALGLERSSIADCLQTLCLVNDSVICHDIVSDTLSNLDYKCIGHFYPNMAQGDMFEKEDYRKLKYSDVSSWRKFLSTKLDPVLRAYSQSRTLIKKGFFIPVPTLGTVYQFHNKITTQFRHSLKDDFVVNLSSLESVKIAISDTILNGIMIPIDGRKIEFGTGLKEPNARLHYGLKHFFRCLSVAYNSCADFHPSDDFGEIYLDHIYNEITNNLFKKTKGMYLKDHINGKLVLPIVEKMSIEDVTRIRLNENIFEELRRTLNECTDLSRINMMHDEKYLNNICEYQKDAVEIWKSKIQQKEKKYFKNGVITGLEGISIGTSIITADTNVAMIGTIACIPGFLNGVVDLIKSSQDPKKKLFKIIRKYRW